MFTLRKLSLVTQDVYMACSIKGQERFRVEGNVIRGYGAAFPEKSLWKITKY